MLHYFNPGHETAVLNASAYYMAPANVVSMQNELAFLLAWCASPNDKVFVYRHILKAYREYIETNLGSFAEDITLIDLQRGKTHLIQNQKLELWGISPQSIHFFEQLNKEFDLKLSIPKWEKEYTELCSRETSSKCLLQLIESISSIEQNILPRFYTSLEDIEQAVRDSPHQLLAKAPYSSSGRGLLWLPVEGLTRTEQQILQGHLNKQKTVSLERALDKQIDFAMEFNLTNNHTHFCGYSLFETNQKGAYLGNYLASQEKIREKLECVVDRDLLQTVQNELTKILQDKITPHYTGYVGVDMLIYRNCDNNYRLHPCVEINVRNNMGILSLNLFQKYIHPHSEGCFRIEFCANEGETLAKHLADETEHPAIFVNKKLLSGYLPLCPINKTSKYRAYMITTSTK